MSFVSFVRFVVFEFCEFCEICEFCEFCRLFCHFLILKFYESDHFVPVKSYFNQAGVILSCQHTVLCETPHSLSPHLYFRPTILGWMITETIPKLRNVLVQNNEINKKRKCGMAKTKRM